MFRKAVRDEKCAGHHNVDPRGRITSKKGGKGPPIRASKGDSKGSPARGEIKPRGWNSSPQRGCLKYFQEGGRFGQPSRYVGVYNRASRGGSSKSQEVPPQEGCYSGCFPRHTFFKKGGDTPRDVCGGFHQKTPCSCEEQIVWGGPL